MLGSKGSPGWILESGLPLEAHAEITSVPFKENDINVSTYTEVWKYTITDQGDCLLDHTRTDMAIEKTGFEGQVRAFSVLINDWKLQPGCK